MSILVTLLLNLLVSYLAKIIENWINSLLNPKGSVPTLEFLLSQKADFLKKLKWRFWLGSDRMSKGALAYDLAMNNYAPVKAALPSGTPISSTQMAQNLCDGIASHLT